ncbi:toxin [Enterobacter bugandensis]|nr:toxin [Enterobacter bugandensis]
MNENILKEKFDLIHSADISTLTDIAAESFHSFYERVMGTLSWQEARQLYDASVGARKKNKIYQARLLARATPLLAPLANLQIDRPDNELRDYESEFGSRATSFVTADSVSSMFSPAAYLTELYREARDLHPQDSRYHLDVRRPDLRNLALSQENLDKECSTLTISNDLLMYGIMNKEALSSRGDVLALLAATRTSGGTPYHHTYQQVRLALAQRDPHFTLFNSLPAVSGLLSHASMLGLESNISPELYDILVEELKEESINALFEKNFGSISPEHLLNAQAIKNYYGLTTQELEIFQPYLSQLDIYRDTGQYQARNTINAQYINDEVTYRIASTQSSAARIVHITRTPGTGYRDGLNYMDLFMQPDGQFFVRLNLKSTGGQISVRISSPRSAWLRGISDDPTAANVEYSSAPFTLEPSDIAGPFTLQILHYSEGSTSNARNFYSSFRVEIFDLSIKKYLLWVNKVIRLCRATQLRPGELNAIIRSVNPDLHIDPSALSKVFIVKYYMRLYQLDVERAIVLSNASIPRQSSGAEPSLFERLFNTPSLNNYYFTPNGETLTFAPAGDADIYTAILNRALKTDAVSLSSLARIVTGDNTTTTLTNTLDNLSALYRASLIAQVHQLSVHELLLLLTILGEEDTGLGSINDEVLRDLNAKIYQLTRWLRSQSLSVYQLFVMTTSVYDTTLTADIENLMHTVFNGVQGFAGTDSELLTAMAPYIASALKLPSEQIARALLVWADALQPGASGNNARQFWNWLQQHINDDPIQNDAATALAVQYCQGLAQISLIYRASGLPEEAFLLVVNRPELFRLTSNISFSHDAEALISLTRFADWLNGLGDDALRILSLFESRELTAAAVAQAMQLDKIFVEQAVNQAATCQQVTTANAFASWPNIDIILQWIEMAQAMNVAPQAVGILTELDYLQLDAQGSTELNVLWENAASSLVAGLDASQANEVHAASDEALSAALSLYSLRHIHTIGASRDDLYQYLLIDNQVSSQIFSTAIAEAIASVQLYVNRALKQIEPEVLPTVADSTFFSDWDRYNKRYSTWAGVSRLVYYPENYIDPLLRIGQTAMMGEMQQSISQSQISSDTVEDALKTYLTRFEDVANLQVVGGYHDHLLPAQGFSYFIGLDEGGAQQYYWRRVDHDLQSHGQLPANAWSEWLKIDTAIRPDSGLVKLVIFKTRLHVVWLESKTVIQGDTQQESRVYEVKIAHIRHDGTWSAPVAVTYDHTLDQFIEQQGSNALGMYCAEQQSENTLLLLFYVKGATSNKNKSTPTWGGDIFSDMTGEALTQVVTMGIKENIYREFDTQQHRRLNNRYAYSSYEYPRSLTSNCSFINGETGLSRVIGGAISSIRLSESTVTAITLQLNATLKVSYEGTSLATTHQARALRQFARPGDGLIVYRTFTIIPGAMNTTDKYYAVYQMAGGSSGLAKGRMLLSRSAPVDLGGEKILLLLGDFETTDNTYMEGIIQNNAFYLEDTDDNIDRLKNPFHIIDGLGIAQVVRDHHILFSELASQDVTLTARVGTVTTTFTAERYVSSQPDANFESMRYDFSGISLTIPHTAFVDNRAEVQITLGARTTTGSSLGQEIFSFTVVRSGVDTEGAVSVPLALHSTGNGAQFLQNGPYRTRINTLFARQLVVRAERGIDSILALASQQLPEPQMGDGGYIRVTLPAYNFGTHGASRDVRLEFFRGLSTDGEKGYYTFWDGQLRDTLQQVTLFVPLSQINGFDNIINFPYSGTGGLVVHLFYNNKRAKMGTLQTNFITDDTGKKTGLKLTGYNASSTALSVQILADYIEPMDFSGANALYFWELFYYTPMMVAQRLLQEQNYDEASRWLKFVWNPAGYVINGILQPYTWNTRPLLEDTSWNSEPLDSTDPDAIAQNDPMHYKVATFMRTLDLLIERGDAAFRQLERDTLNEAKMWYMQALSLLGSQPLMLPDLRWTAPALADAADKTLAGKVQQALTAVRTGDTPEELSGDTHEVFTANSLTNLFMPEFNMALMDYWGVLEQRLYNLRHNLSIDGKPLRLPVYASPADPKAMLTTAATSSQGGVALPGAIMPPWRFPVMLDRARSLVLQLCQYGSSLLNIIERQDGESLNSLLLNQATELYNSSLQLQDKAVEEINAEQIFLEAARVGVEERLRSYTALYDENINRGEKLVMDLRTVSATVTAGTQTVQMAAAALEMVPNIYGMAVGGSRYGALLNAVAIGGMIGASSTEITADKIGQSEVYRRRREEWEIQRNSAQAELAQITAQLQALSIRHQAAVMQKTQIETQQAQTQAQLELLQRKFSGHALYGWLRGRLASIYFQFYDQVVTQCLMAQRAWQWDLNDKVSTFIRPGAWQGTYAGLLSGETLMLNLAQMENAYLKSVERELEVTRTVSLAEFYATLSDDGKFTFTDKVRELVTAGKGSVGSGTNKLEVVNNQLQVSIKLSDLNITADYPDSAGVVRRIKQISITLPALVGPYQDVQAMLTYGGSIVVPRGCEALAISHGIMDSGQFQLDFNDARYLPFEGIPINDSGSLNLSFPHVNNKQKELLLSLTDIIVHIRYTIRS